MNNKRWMIGSIIVIAVIALFAAFSTPGVSHFSSTRQLEAFLEENTQPSNGNMRETALAEGASDTKSTGESTSASVPAPADSNSYSTTNIQVQGVDEPDFVKNDGTYIYIARDSTITITQAYPAETAHIVSQVEVNGYITNMFLKGDQLIILGVEQQRPIPVDRGGGDGSTTTSEAKLVAPGYYAQSRSFVHIYDITDRSHPTLYKEFAYDGSYLDARMVNGYVYLIANQPLITTQEGVTLPTVTYNGEKQTIAATDIAYFQVPDYGYQLTTIIAFELDDLERTPAYESFLTGYTQTLYMSTNNLYLTAPKYVPYETYEQRMLDEVIIPRVEGETRANAEKIRAMDKPLYEQQQMIEVIIADYYNQLSKADKESFTQELSDSMTAFQKDWQQEMQKTIIHKIHIEANDITYVGKGEVPGYPLNQFSMDEHAGYLRIATTTNSWFGGWGAVPLAVSAVDEQTVKNDGEYIEEVPSNDVSENDTPRAEIPETPIREPVPFPSPAQTTVNNVVVLDENLKIVGALENLAEGERIYSARFIGNRAYLVTFKQTDPLFVIDVSEPSNPTVLGELKIPGYSTYLHPFDETTLIGIGQDSDGEIDEGGFRAAIPAGVKIGLFDVSDPANPQEIDHYTIGDRGSWSDALYDHKAFLFNPETGLLVLPMSVQEKIAGREASTPEEQLWYPTTTTFQGAYVFKLSRENGIQLQGTITHLTASERIEMEQAKAGKKDYYYPPYEAQIQRSMYLGDTLYTLSQRSLQANDLATLNEVKSINLPITPPIYYASAEGNSGGGSAGANEATPRVESIPSQ